MYMGAVMARRPRRYVSIFQEAQAVTADRAKTLSELGIRKTFIFSRMAEQGVFVRATDNKYYLDEEAVETYFMHQRRRKLFVGVFVLGLGALLIFLYR